MKNVYGPEIENQMRQLYESFSEKDRRRYAAIEAYKLSHGGVAYIAGLFGCHPDTIARCDQQHLAEHLKAWTKELIGSFARSGQAWTDGSLHAFDHDFGSYRSDQKAIPYGVYDTVANEALVYLATGADTGELAADAVRRWWHRLGKFRYAGAGGILHLADCGGSNGYRVPLYRERLHQVACILGIPNRVAHLPPYCSKYNPIDHRLFCRLTQAISGRLVESLAWLQMLFSKVSTSTGLNVVCELARKTYESGIKAATEFVNNEPTQRDQRLGQFNYVLPT